MCEIKTETEYYNRLKELYNKQDEEVSSVRTKYKKEIDELDMTWAKQFHDNYDKYIGQCFLLVDGNYIYRLRIDCIRNGMFIIKYTRADGSFNQKFNCYDFVNNIACHKLADGDLYSISEEDYNKINEAFSVYKKTISDIKKKIMPKG